MFGDKNKDVQQLTVSDVKSIVTKGATPTTLGYKFDVNGTINFIKVENITDNGDFLGPFDKISEECNLAMLRSELQAEDILVSIAGTLGKTAIVDEGILPANTNQAVAIIRLDKSKSILPEYLYYYLKQDSAFSQFDDMKKIANRANLSLENIDNIKIPNYSKELQLEFINYAKSCDKLKFEAMLRLLNLIVSIE